MRPDPAKRTFTVHPTLIELVDGKLAIRLRLELPKLVAAWRLAQTADHPVDRPAQRFAEALGYWTVSPGKDTYSTGIFSAPPNFPAVPFQLYR